MITVHLQYFALFREQAGGGQESLQTNATDARELYAELKHKHGFRLPPDNVRVAANQSFTDWTYRLRDGDHLVFIPPVAGG